MHLTLQTFIHFITSTLVCDSVAIKSEDLIQLDDPQKNEACTFSLSLQNILRLFCMNRMKSVLIFYYLKNARQINSASVHGRGK